MTDKTILKVSHIKKRYGQVEAVRGVDFSLQKGMVFTLLGPNGAGKTTLLEIAEGLRRPDEGTIDLFGEHITSFQPRHRERIGVLLQEMHLIPQLKVHETLALFASFYRKPVNIQYILGLVQLEEKKDDFIRNLSGGQRQRVHLALSFLNDPELLFLDEPTTGLDPQARRSIWSIIENFRSKGNTVFLTTHSMEEAEKLSDEIAIMDYGQIIARGTPDDLCQSLGEEDVIEFTTPNLDGVMEILKEADLTAERNGDRFTLKTRDVPDTLRQVLGLGQARHIRLEHLTIRRPNLEDVFLSLTGRSLRD